MAKWSGSSYEGPTKYEWEDGIGKHKFPNGVVYEGNFEKGEFHGEGTLHYPNGVGPSNTHNHFSFAGTLRGQVGPRQADRRKVLLLR
jgi:hypothetical protein